MSRDLKEVFREAFDLPEEAERRWREIESGTVDTIPWEEVRAKLFRRQ